MDCHLLLRPQRTQHHGPRLFWLKDCRGTTSVPSLRSFSSLRPSQALPPCAGSKPQPLGSASYVCAFLSKVEVADTSTQLTKTLLRLLSFKEWPFVLFSHYGRFSSRKLAAGERWPSIIERPATWLLACRFEQGGKLRGAGKRLLEFKEVI